MNLQNKVAVVTGASSGIGEATAKLLSKNGAKVALIARSEKKLKSLEIELKNSKSYVCDVTDFEKVKKTVEKIAKDFGGIDILVNNAGRGYHVPILEIVYEKYEYLFKLNTIAPLILMQSVYPIMKKNKESSIVNISSGTSVMAIPGIGAYSSTKRALNALSLTARAEFAKDNIKVSLVYPYITRTNFHKNLLNGNTWDMDDSGDLPEYDMPEKVAEKIQEAIMTGKEEVFVHEWIGK